MSWRYNRLLALPANIRLGRKKLPGTDTLAYFVIEGEKSFYDVDTRYHGESGLDLRKREIIKFKN
jgi:hypothetical protein